MTSEIRAILFDFDMTLIDSSYAITACMNGMAKDLQLAEEIGRASCRERV